MEISLYNESDGIVIGLSNELDIVPLKALRDLDGSVRVRGHRLYACSIGDAQQSIRTEYLRRFGIPDPLSME